MKSDPKLWGVVGNLVESFFFLCQLTQTPSVESRFAVRMIRFIFSMDIGYGFFQPNAKICSRLELKASVHYSPLSTYTVANNCSFCSINYWHNYRWASRERGAAVSKLSTRCFSIGNRIERGSLAKRKVDSRMASNKITLLHAYERRKKIKSTKSKLIITATPKQQ